MLNGSDKVAAAFLLASDSEKILLAVKSALKKSVSPAMFTRTITAIYRKNLI
jgi:hypothetical protein